MQNIWAKLHVAQQITSDCEGVLVERVPHFQEFEPFVEPFVVLPVSEVNEPNERWCFEKEQLESDEDRSGDETHAIQP